MKALAIILETLYKILLITGSFTAAYFTTVIGLGETMMTGVIVGSCIALITAGMLFSPRIQRELHNVRPVDKESLRNDNTAEANVAIAQDEMSETAPQPAENIENTADMHIETEVSQAPETEQNTSNPDAVAEDDPEPALEATESPENISEPLETCQPEDIENNENSGTPENVDDNESMASVILHRSLTNALHVLIINSILLIIAIFALS